MQEPKLVENAPVEHAVALRSLPRAEPVVRYPQPRVVLPPKTH